MMISEDFGAFLQKIPGCFIFLGNGDSSDAQGNTPLHNACYDFNDEILLTGAEYFARGRQSPFAAGVILIGPIAECRRAMFLACLFNRRQVESLAQGADEGLIVADGFPGLSESFATGLPLHSTSLITILKRFNLRQIAG